jgi:hypothetical protein
MRGVDVTRALRSAASLVGRFKRADELSASERIAYAQAYATLAVGHALFGLLQQRLQDRYPAQMSPRVGIPIT